MSLLAFHGLRYPAKLLPLLLFESAWKLLWLGLVALPKAIDGNLDQATSDIAFNCSFVVLILAVIPWATCGAPTCARPETGGSRRPGSRQRGAVAPTLPARRARDVSAHLVPAGVLGCRQAPGVDASHDVRRCPRPCPERGLVPHPCGGVRSARVRRGGRAAWFGVPGCPARWRDRRRRPRTVQT